MARSVGRSVLIYACAFAVAGATPFLLLPVLTRALSPQQFGEITSFLILTAAIANLAGLSAHGFVSVRWFKTPAAGFAPLAGGALAALLATHGVALLAVAVGSGLLLDLLGLPLGLALLAVPAALLLSCSLVALAIFQSSGQPQLYLSTRVAQAVVELLGCLALLYWWRADATARTHSYMLGLAVSAALGLALCWRRGHLAAVRPSREQLNALLAFGVPMLPHIAAGTAITYLDRVVVSSLLGAESLGLYMVAMQIGMAMSLVMEPLNKALAPWLFGQLARNDARVRRSIVKRTYALYVALALVGAAVALAAHLFFDVLIGARYAAAAPLVGWLVAGFVLQGMYYSVVNYLFYAERTGRLSVVSATTAAVGCVVSYALTSWLGLVGAGVSFAINNALLFALVWVVAARTVPMPWLLRR